MMFYYFVFVLWSDDDMTVDAINEGLFFMPVYPKRKNWILALLMKRLCSLLGDT